MNNKVSFSVCGMNYHITTDESAEYTEALANEIQEKINELEQKNEEYMEEWTLLSEQSVFTVAEGHKGCSGKEV